MHDICQKLNERKKIFIEILSHGSWNSQLIYLGKPYHFLQFQYKDKSNRLFCNGAKYVISSTRKATATNRRRRKKAAPTKIVWKSWRENGERRMSPTSPPSSSFCNVLSASGNGHILKIYGQCDTFIHNINLSLCVRNACIWIAFASTEILHSSWAVN